MKKHITKQNFIKHFHTARHHNESGQIIILMVFGMVVLLAATGLAVDGGRLVYLKRDAQNATDAAILAATYALCAGETGSAVEDAGLAASGQNGFVNGSNGVTVAVHSPPTDNSNTDVNGDNTYVEVTIEAAIPATLIHLITGRSTMETTSYGVGHCNVPDTTQNLAAYEAAVLTFGEGCETGIDFNGSEGHYSEITGNLVSNKDIRIVSAGAIEGSVQTLEGSERYGSGTMTATGGETTYTTSLSPTPYLFDIYDYAPGGDKAEYVINSFGSEYYHAYDQTSKVQFNHDTLEGLYYFSEITDTIQFVGVDVGAMGATIVAHHGMDFEATKDTQFVSFIDDLLIFSLTEQEDCNTSGVTGSVKMAGYTYWEGLFYVPNGYVDLPGSGVEGYGAVIANDFSSRISEGKIVYKADIIPQVDIDPPTIEIAQ